jgi:hypothetical protein
MTICLVRMAYTDASTQGLLYFESLAKFVTLEPAKDSGMLMPLGTYHCQKTMSPRMGYRSPELFNVPGHTGERIHVGNYPTDTKGCILVGMTRARDFVGDSHKAFEEMMVMLPEEFDIEIRSAADDSPADTVTSASSATPAPSESA